MGMPAIEIAVSVSALGPLDQLVTPPSRAGSVASTQLPLVQSLTDRVDRLPACLSKTWLLRGICRLNQMIPPAEAVHIYPMREMGHCSRSQVSGSQQSSLSER